MNTTISFETAKLLKEKGFDEITGKYWAKINQSDKDFVINKDWMTHKWNSLNKPIWSAPTIAEVVMWLYEKHSLWILPLPTVCGYFAWKIIDMQDDPNRPIERPPYNDVDGVDYKTPAEAYEAAIVYALNNIV